MSFNKFNTPFGIGRGRGLLLSPVPFTLGEPVVHIDDTVECDDVVPPGIDPCVEFDRPKCTSTSARETANDNVSLVDQMSDIVQQIGHQLADSIMTRLSTLSPTTDMPKSHVDTPDMTDSAHSRALDLSRIQLIAQGPKDPPVFRGDGSDTVTVEEWEESMRNYIRKSGVLLESQSEEILVHLRGRAKDVVRFGIRNGEINVIDRPHAIYGLLRKHFSTSLCSSVPLADFYSTLPKENEDPYEFWLRLNRAADSVASCLKEQGKTFDNPNVEITRMFIRHCPNRELALTFRSKTIDKWSAREVQEVLDEYHLERGVRCSGGGHDKVIVNKFEVQPSASAAADYNDRKPAADDSALEKLTAMLEKVLLQNQSNALVSKRPRSSTKFTRIEGLYSKPCSVCKEDSHNTFTHCRDDRLCFLCHAPGHSRRDCPQGNRTSFSGQQGN